MILNMQTCTEWNFKDNLTTARYVKAFIDKKKEFWYDSNDKIWADKTQNTSQNSVSSWAYENRSFLWRYDASKSDWVETQLYLQRSLSLKQALWMQKADTNGGRA